MPTRLRSRVSAVEEKVARSVRKNAIRLYFVEGYPTDGAEDLLRETKRKALETEELDCRLTALEQQLSKRK